MAYVDDNNYQIPYLTETTTFLSWANYHNTLVVNKLNSMKIYDGVSGDGIVFTLGTTAANDPVGGETAGRDLPAGTIRCSLASVIPHGITFAGDVSIDGNFDYDLTSIELPAITRKIYPLGGKTACFGYTLGNPVRFEGGVGGGDLRHSKADNAGDSEVVGLVSDVTYPVSGTYNSSNTYVTVTLSGKIEGDFGGALDTGHGGLSGGCIYFLSAGTSGGLTPVEPTIGGHVSKPVLMGATTGYGYVTNYRGQLLQGTGTGGTGGIDNNRFIINVGAGTGIERGHVVGYFPEATTSGWFPLSASYNEHIGRAVGLCITSPFVVDSQTYIQIVTTGFLDNIPSNSMEGLLYVGVDGKLTSTYPGESAKPFAMAWTSSGTGVGPYRGTILNQNHNGGGAVPAAAGGSNTARSSGGGAPWAYRTTSTGVTYGSAINENIMINGSFDIWQRGIAAGTIHGITGTTYFADKWVRVDGVSGGGGTAGEYYIERKSFASNQTEVYGRPNYYTTFKNHITPKSGKTGDYVYIENRIEDVRTLRNEDVTLSWYARCGATGESMKVVVNQYDGTNTYTSFPAKVSLGTLWQKYEVSFLIPNIETTPSGKHYLGLGFNSAFLNTNIDLAMVKLERGLVATTNDSPIVSEELEKCSRYYQRSYGVDEKNATETMFGVTRPKINVVDFTITPKKDLYYNFPVTMRDTPEITFYSPKNGYTGDAYNRTADRNLLNTSGTRGYNTEPRVVSSGATTIVADIWSKTGMHVFVPAGAVLFDSVSFHYVADADLNDNMPNT